ncbi:MAG: hypothetical protein LBJ65_17555 [Burkholderia sp.]|jgi:hypothetical protein|uniref:hypothetical protein n=1 Tax=Burkholderia sp. TaxID=36773 RepID=UPI0028209146|nr:hypothetical protein [Burkholderia sp.]MDR0243402.1 hypothetical protein [Burkholderia sp.]
MDYRAEPAVRDRFKADTCRAATGLAAWIDAASSVETPPPDGHGTLRAFTPKALDRLSRRLTKYFDKVRAQGTRQPTYSAQDASGETMKTSISISIAVSPGMSDAAAMLPPGTIPDGYLAFRQASPDRKHRTPARARPHPAAARFTGLSVCVPLTMDGKPKRSP